MVEASEQRASPVAQWAETKAWASFELALVALIFYADRHHLVPFSKTPVIVLLGWISIRLRGIGWRAVGLARFRNWRTTLGLGTLAGICMEALELFVTQPALVRLTHKWPDLSHFRPLIGNAKLLPVALLLVWILAALGEELAYRGYLMNRVAELGRNTRKAWAIGLIVVSTAFGFGHFDQGLTGMVENMIAGLFLSWLYLRSGRNLALPIVAHGTQDTIDLLLIFFDKYPGM